METVFSPELRVMYAKDLGDGTTEVIYQKRCYTTEEAGKILDITPGQLRTLIKHGAIAAARPGVHKIVITHEVIEQRLTPFNQ